MNDSSTDHELASMIAKFQLAYGDSIVILPDGESVTVVTDGETRTTDLVRGSPVWFQRDGQVWRAGTLRFALRYGNRPEGVVTVPDGGMDKIFRIPVTHLRLTPPIEP